MAPVMPGANIAMPNNGLSIPNVAFLAIAVVTLIAAVAAMSLRNLVHCGLCLAVVLAGLAALYLQLNAQFIGLSQVLIYIGAVAVLILFTILLTRGKEPERSPLFSAGWPVGLLAAGLLFGVLALAVLVSPARGVPAPVPVQVTVRQIGESLMSRFVLPLQVAGLLLTAALIGAVVVALPRDLRKRPSSPPGKADHLSLR